MKHGDEVIPGTPLTVQAKKREKTSARKTETSLMLPAGLILASTDSAPQLTQKKYENGTWLTKPLLLFGWFSFSFCV